MGVMMAVGNNDGKARQGAVLDVGAQVGEIDDFARRPIDVFDYVTVPGRSIVAAVVRSAVVVVRSGNGTSRGSVGLGINFPGDSRVVEHAEDIVVGDCIGGAGSRVEAAVAIAVEIVGSGGKRAIGSGMTTAGC